LGGARDYENRKKLEEKSQNCDKTTDCHNATSRVIKTKHGTGVDPGDMVTSAKFGLHRLGGFGAGGMKVRCFVL
jgi:hypothetical protein